LDETTHLHHPETCSMHIVSRSLIRALGIVVLASVLASCNIEGLFTKYEDAPVWEDPNAAAAQAAGAADAGGPGKAVYARICVTCHMGSGKGAPNNNIPPLAGSALAQGDASVPIRIVLHGFRGPIERNGAAINGQMAAWKSLSDQEIADVLTYVRSAFGNNGAAVTSSEVAAVREETKSRLTPYTEAEL
jgi:nitrite reductase (NO-forming)